MYNKKIRTKISNNSRFEYLNSNETVTLSENELLDAALKYAALGFPVFPVHNPVFIGKRVICSCSESEECGKIGKHPRTRFGHSEATTDETAIRYWWNRYPQANIGLLTGIESNLLVLDVDVKDGGHYSLDDLQDDYRTILKSEFDSVSATLAADTGSGGNHYYFNYPREFTIGGSASLIGQGLDIRAEGNYIIAPPSLHKSGRNYSWFGVNTPITDAPQWLIYAIIQADEERKAAKVAVNNSISSKPKIKEKVPKGGGNVHLFKQARGLSNSFPKAEVLKRILIKNQTELEAPLPEKEVERIVESAFSYSK